MSVQFLKVRGMLEGPLGQIFVLMSKGGPKRRGEGRCESVLHGSYFLRVSVGRGFRVGDVTRVEGVDRVKGGGWAPLPSASWAENTIMIECTQESRHFQSKYSLVCGGSQRSVHIGEMLPPAIRVVWLGYVFNFFFTKRSHTIPLIYYTLYVGGRHLCILYFHCYCFTVLFTVYCFLL